MIPKAKQQLNPKVTATVILIVLVVIQWVWWRGLVAKPKAERGRGGPMPSLGRGDATPVVTGRNDVRVETIAGEPEPGDSDGAGYQARFDSPTGIARDAQGNLYVADSHNHRIRKIEPNGKVSTLAGSTQGDKDGPAAQAQFSLPSGVAAAPDGAIYVADTGNHRIRRIQDGQVTTLAGSTAGFAEGQGTAVKFNAPCAITFLTKPTPVLAVADALNRRVRLLDLSGKITGGWTVPGAPTAVLDTASPVTAVPQAGAFITGTQILRDLPIDLSGTPEAKQADFTLRRPLTLCAAPGGWFVTDAEQCGVFYVTGGKAQLIAGRSHGHSPFAGWSDSDGHQALFSRVTGIVSDGAGHLYVCDTGANCIRRITLPNDLTAKKETQP